MSWHFSVLVDHIWDDSSAASTNVLQLPLLSHSYCFSNAALAPWWFKYLFSSKTRSFPRDAEKGYTLCSSWKGILSPLLQEAESPLTLRKSETIFTSLCALKSTLRLKALLLLASMVKRDSHSNTSVEEEFDDSEDEDECCWKFHSKITVYTTVLFSS